MVFLKRPEEIERLRASNRIVAEVLARLRESVVAGVTTLELNRLSEEMARSRGAVPAFKGYRGYPYALCVSVNDEVVHGMPSAKRVLKEGDIVSIDFGVFYRGYFGDAAITVPVGVVSEEARRLMRVTEESLYRAVDQARVGNRLGDISYAVQDHVERAGFSVVREFVGHGIGREMHEDPQIPNFGRKGRGIVLKAGMVLAIEPMVNAGSYEVRVLADGWTAVTADGSLSAHFEHSVAIMEEGPEILSVC
ncbi:MAG TPA: type I methionyl aminopeptidase [Syntrophales bacterium]|nr:type I methionyl aminopeptidase [Syntrophales bacterium]HOM06788.1 type I methionyl aminopeptidase [Syntrophales bacterium]HON99517.1 type I methionyl aminopeptidase [Syntrophales bacterium]HPQ06054.1 type I methionyl aminopeptidase [Syntrophales bacterium]